MCFLLFSGVALALNQEDASATVDFSTTQAHPGDTIGFRVTFNASNSQQLQVKYIGVHFDWMAEDSFTNPVLSDSATTISPDGSYISNPFFITIPYNVSAGAHTYFVGVDGTDSTGDFQWTGPSQTIPVTYVGSQPTPASTPTPSGGASSASGGFGLLTILLAVAVVAIVVAVVIVVMELRKKPKKAKLQPEAEKASPPVEQPKKEQEKDSYDI